MIFKYSTFNFYCKLLVSQEVEPSISELVVDKAAPLGHIKLFSCTTVNVHLRLRLGIHLSMIGVY